VAEELSADERLEYQEIGAFARHDDTVMLAVSSLLLPALFAALAWAWQPESGNLRIPLALGSFLIWLYWAVVTQRRGDFAAVRYGRAQELECKAGLHHHLRIDAKDRLRRPVARIQGIKTIEIVGSLSLLGAWFWLVVSPNAQSLALVGILVAAAVAIVLVRRAVTKPPRRPPCEEAQPGIAQPPHAGSSRHSAYVPETAEHHDSKT
jgi:hypothetical protein